MDRIRATRKRMLAERASAASARSPQPTPSPQQRASPATSTKPSSREDPALADTPSPAPTRPKTSSALPTTSASPVDGGAPDAPAVAEAEKRHSTTKLWADQLAAMERIREARRRSQAAKKAAVRAASAGAGTRAQTAAKGAAKKSPTQGAVAVAAERVAPSSAFLERFLEGHNTMNTIQNVRHRTAASNQSLALTAARAARPMLDLAAKKGNVAAVRRCALSIAEEQRFALCSGLLQEVAGLFGFDLRARRMDEDEGPEPSPPQQGAQTPDGEGEGATPCAKAVLLATLQDAPQGGTGSPREALSPGGSSLGKRKAGVGLRIDASHRGLDGSSDLLSPRPVFQSRKATRTAPGASTTTQSGVTRIAKAASVKSRQRPPLAKLSADKDGECKQLSSKRGMAHAAGAAAGKRRALSLDGGVCAAGLFGAAISGIAKR